MVGKLIIGTEVDDTGFKEGLKDIQETADKESIDIDVDVDDAAMDVVESKATGVLGKLKTFGMGLANVVSSAILGILKIVTVIGLAFAGIMAAGAGLFILIKAIDKIKDSDSFKQIKTDIQYIIYALGQLLAPAINAVGNFIIKMLKGIVNLIKTIIFYIAYLIKAWTGYDMFKNLDTKNFAKDMEKSSKSAKDTAKAAKEINKQLAGFDEMNILSDNSSSGGGTASAAGGGGTPSFNMEGDWANMKVPGWLEWLGKNGDKVISILSGIAAALIAVKLGIEPLMALGIGIVIASVVQFIQDLIDMIKNPSWDKFADLLRDVSGILLGISIVLISINASNPVGWIMLLVSGLTLLVSEIIKHWDKIREWLGKVWDKITGMFDELWNIIKTGAKGAWDGIVSVFSGLASFFTKTFGAAWDGVKKLFAKGGLIFKGITDGITSAFKTVVNAIISGINAVIALPFNKINGLLNTIKNLSFLGISPFKKLWKKDPLPVPQIPKLAKGAIASYPGRGIPTAGGGAIWAEAGQEAYLPLTDTQFLENLGATIGKNVNIAATIPIYVGNRMIERQNRKIAAQNDFAANR